MKKRINKILWYGDDLSDGKSKAPSISTCVDGLDGLNEGELYIANNEKDPAIFIRTSSGKVVRIGVNLEELKKHFLSKTEDDTASGLITFSRGLAFGDGQVRLTLDADGNLCLTRKDGSEATFWASGGVSAKGPGLTGGGTGGIVENIYGSDMLGTVFSDADLTKTFNAYTINYINTRVTSLGNTMGILSGKVDNVESKVSGLTGDVTGIDSRLGDVEGKVNDFFADANKDGIINKWKELEEVLKGLSESDNLATILSYKIGEVEITGTGNAVTGFSKEGSKLTLKKESTFLTSHQTIYDLIFKVNGTSLLTFDPNGKAGELNLASGEGISVSGSDSTITISTDINALKELFLSKVEDDSAAGVINFQKGITFGDGEMTLALDEEGNLSLTRKDGTQATFWASGGISAKGKGLDGGTGGATTLGGLMNVEDDVDEDTEEDVVLVREADGTHWTKKALKDVIGENATSDKNYIYVQDESSATWIITHGLNKYPSVTVIDSSSSVVYGEVIYNSASQLTLNFGAAFSGRAILN